MPTRKKASKPARKTTQASEKTANEDFSDRERHPRHVGGMANTEVPSAKE